MQIGSVIKDGEVDFIVRNFNLSYLISEVDNLKDTNFPFSILTTEVDLNSLGTGLYSKRLSDCPNEPVTNHGLILCCKDIGTPFQIFITDNDTRIFKRSWNSSNSTYNNWVGVTDYLSYVSGTSWYRVHSDGWIEQGGRVTTASSGTITFHKAFSNTNFTMTSQEGDGNALTSSTDTSGYDYGVGLTNFTTTSVRYSCASGRYISWYACGY